MNQDEIFQAEYRTRMTRSMSDEEMAREMYDAGQRAERERIAEIRQTELEFAVKIASALNNAADQSHVCPKCKIEFVTRMPKCPICYHRKKSADQSRVIEVLENTLLDVRDKHGVIDCVSYTRKRIVDDYVSHRLWVRDKVNKALAEAQRIMERK